MFISKLEMASDPSLAGRLRGWAGSLNKSAKSASPQNFEIAGPMVLGVRQRTARGTNTVNHAFMGGEKFVLNSVMMNQVPEKNGVDIVAMFMPVELDLVAQIMSVTLPLADALDVLTGFSAWVDLSVIDTELAAAERVRAAKEVVHLPTVEETRASTTWGAW